jgi:hypothetical protein
MSIALNAFLAVQAADEWLCRHLLGAGVEANINSG